MKFSSGFFFLERMDLGGRETNVILANCLLFNLTFQLIEMSDTDGQRH